MLQVRVFPIVVPHRLTTAAFWAAGPALQTDYDAVIEWRKKRIQACWDYADTDHDGILGFAEASKCV